MSEKPTPTVKMPDPVEFSQTMEKIAEQSQTVVSEFLARQQREPVGERLEQLKSTLSTSAQPSK